MNPRPNDLWAIIANVGHALTQWLVLAILARLGSVDVLGQYALALALSAPIFMCANMRLRFIQATDSTGRFEFSHFVTVRVATTVLAAGLTLVIGVMFETGRAILPLILSVIAVKMAESIQDVYIGRYQSWERMSAAARSLLSSGVIGVALFAITYRMSSSVAAACSVMALTRVFIVVVIDVLDVGGWGTPVPAESAEGRNQRGRSDQSAAYPSRDIALQLVGVAWPLGIVALLDSLNTNIPRYFLAAGDSLSDVGQYSGIVYLVFAGFVVVNSLGQSRVPHLARAVAGGHWVEASRAVRGLLLGTVAIGLAGIIVAALGGNSVLQLLYGSDFANIERTTFVLIMFAGSLTYLSLVMIYVLTAHGQTRIQVALYAINTVVVLLGSAVLIPVWTLNGAAIALIAANLVQILTSAIILSKVDGNRRAREG